MFPQTLNENLIVYINKMWLSEYTVCNLRILTFVVMKVAVSEIWKMEQNKIYFNITRVMFLKQRKGL